MATPRVFISSTCYDLNEVREILESYLDEIYFETILSNKGHVYYQPGLHTHDSCLKEISNCDLFILIIGGRYGGTYISDETKSIVNAEYDAAIQVSIPIVSFVKKDVWDNHLFFKKNHQKDTECIIEYPAIENQKTAIKIFEFIDRVRLAEKNNGIFTFSNSKEIVDTLKKQFAGMIYNHLIHERKINYTNILNEQLHEIKLISTKSNELIENLFVQLSQNNPTAQIKEIEETQMVLNFFFHIHQHFNIKHINDWLPLKRDNSPFPTDWSQYIVRSNDFQIISSKNPNTVFKILVHINSLLTFNLDIDSKEYKILAKYFSYFNVMSPETFNNALQSVFNNN